LSPNPNPNPNPNGTSYESVQAGRHNLPYISPRSPFDLAYISPIPPLYLVLYETLQARHQYPHCFGQPTRSPIPDPNPILLTLRPSPNSFP
jgi:hypothetical protein